MITTTWMLKNTLELPGLALYGGSIRIPKECNAKLLAGASYIVIDDGAFVKKFSELTMPEKGFLQALKKTQG
ncbi:hypothetical protein ANCCAN_22679 [Ancylostoma caninum]|uniref:Uncharacterized protein n=1 Tax=Ancylostoma caninum TaxID=29170 RepID=A0A368FHJ7_ANCCA|nr:hypothetical protein ANCCAN_22679 [Ancylostoma caninum]